MCSAQGELGAFLESATVELVVRFLCTHVSKVNIKGNVHF